MVGRGGPKDRIQGKTDSEGDQTGSDRGVMTVVGEGTGQLEAVDATLLPAELPVEVVIGQEARGDVATLLDDSVTDRIRRAGLDASASDALGILDEANGLPTGERDVVTAMTGRLATVADPEDRNVQTWEYENVLSGRTIRLRIGWDKAMRPSDSTGLLVTHMRITPGESVLDLGTGTGVIAIAAHELGAGNIMASDLHPEFADEISVNLRLNRLSTPERASVQMLFGDMFSPVLGEMLDHVISNPASIPCPPGKHLDIHYDSGTEGRDIIDRLLREVSTVLKPGGRLTMVHGSLSNMPRTLRMLGELGFTGIEISEPKEFPFKDFYPTEYLKLLKAQGKAKFREERCQDGSFKYFETRCVITAKLAERPK